MTCARRHVLKLAAASVLAFPLPLFADSRGAELAQDRYARDRGWGDSQADARMTLTIPGRGQSVREMQIKALEVPGDGDLSLTEFNTPRDLAGTKFLSHSHATKPDDQWLYLPGQGKTRRISSRNKSGAFLGSEFTFEDLSSFKVGKYTYSLEGSGSAGGENCHILSQVPIYEHTGYTAIRVWLDTSHLRPMKAEFLDRRGTHFKTMEFASYKQYGRYWRAHRVSIVNLTNGRSTEMDFSRIAFGVGLSPSAFQPSRLG